MLKVILLSQYPLPYNCISSWPKMYEYYLSKNQHLIDYIVCPKIPSSKRYSTVKYKFANKLPYERLSKKIFKYKYFFYLKKVVEIIRKEGCLIIKIVDNIGLLNELHDYLLKKKVRNNVKIVFFIHGFSYFFNSYEGIQFYEKIDNIVFLTKSSYLFELSRYSYITSQVHFLPNGVDSAIFFKSNYSPNSEINKIRFIWVSQEKPKKGLHIILNAWKNSSLYNDPKFELIVIGTDVKDKSDGNIKWLGKISNEQLPVYFQSSDYYLFTTLCHEGTPLSLIEAIKCGCTAICSNIPPLDEVTENGKYSYLVDIPHRMESWVNILEKIKENKIPKINLSKEELDRFYDINTWCENLNKILLTIKSCTYTSSSPMV